MPWAFFISSHLFFFFILLVMPCILCQLNAAPFPLNFNKLALLPEEKYFYTFEN